MSEGLIGVLIITGRADFGGGPKNVLRLLEKIDKSRFRMVVASPDEAPFARLYTGIEGVETVTLPLRPKQFLLLEHWFGLKILLALMRIIRKDSISIVHSQDKSAGSWSRMLKILNPRLKVVHHFRGIHYRGYPKIFQKLYFQMEHWLAKLTSRFVHVSASEAAEARRVFGLPMEKQVVVHNGVESSEGAKELEIRIYGSHGASAGKETTANLPGEFKGVCIARYCYQKNLSATFSIIGKLKETIPGLCLTVVGGADEYSAEQIEQEIKQAGAEKNIHLAGYCGNVSDYLAGADFYLSTARWEGLPTGILEAMASGLPVVASEVTGNVDAVSPETGFLVPLDDEEAFCASVQKLFNDKALRGKMGESARAVAEERFGVARMAREIEKVYNDSLSGTKR